jgi:nucleotide-binding universal stress UspA family protein
VIARFAVERRVSEIVVGSHGRTGLMAQMLGSVTDQVVKLAHCHVTVVR